ncbi:MAG: DUF2807 domain-containing protein [Cyclobacteriaceae bacterium]|nr:DUF2807 domain-containing protein [Cyclobacteriaceae bacterium]
MKIKKIFDPVLKIWPLMLIMMGIYLAGCLNNDEDVAKPVTGEGPVISMPLEVDSFNRVRHVSMGDMSIVVSDTFSVVLEAQQNILDLMDWTVEDETFYWGFKEAVEIIEADKILCVIRIPHDIESVILSGIGSIGIIGYKQEDIYLELTGYGNIGAYAVEVDKAEAYLSGVGNIEVRANEELSGLISGRGSIYYRGNPTLNIHVSSSGTVVDDN